MFIAHSLQWHICLLHTNELPLWHLIQRLDGKTNNPRGFSGAIEKMLENCVRFELIEIELPIIDPNELNTDQNYPFNNCNGILSGNISSSLSLWVPGKLSHSRWLTTPNRIFSLYVAITELSMELKMIAKYVIKVYLSSWLEIKMKSTCKD